jgi:hypothetical protein
MLYMWVWLDFALVIMKSLGLTTEIICRIAGHLINNELLQLWACTALWLWAACKSLRSSPSVFRI